MYPEGQISRPLLLATVVVALAAFTAFRSSDWGLDTAMRVLLEPMEAALRSVGW